MALVNKLKLAEVDQQLMDIYKEYSNVGASTVSPIIRTVSTGGRKNFVHAFIAGHPQPRVWDGERIVKSLKNREIFGATRKYEITLGVDVEDAMSDVLAQHVVQFEQIGKGATRHLDKLVADFLSNGTSAAEEFENYDLLPLFDADHVTDSSAANSNLNTTRALTYANLLTSYEAMRAMTNDLDSPLTLTPKFLIVPAALEMTARELMENALRNNGDTNLVRNLLEIIVLPELDSSSATTWYLCAGDMPCFINHELEAPTMVSATDPSDDNVRWDDELVYFWTARRIVKAGPYALLQRNEA